MQIIKKRPLPCLVPRCTALRGGAGRVLAGQGGVRLQEEKEGVLAQQRVEGCHWGDPIQVALPLMGSVFPLCSSSAPGSALDPYSPCNKNCECQTDSFTPVCGADGITYLSACFAGCNSTVLVIFWRGGLGQGTREPE